MTGPPGPGDRDPPSLPAEQAAALRVTELLSRDVSRTELFEVVTHEASHLVADALTTLNRAGDNEHLAVAGSTGTPAFEGTGGCSQIEIPMVVAGRLWGTLRITPDAKAVPLEAEVRLRHFAAAMAPALDSADIRAELRERAEEHAAVHRLIAASAEDRNPEVWLRRLVADVSVLAGGAGAVLERIDDATVAIVLASSIDALSVPAHRRVANDAVLAEVQRTGRPVRNMADRKLSEGAAEAQVTRRTRIGVPLLIDSVVWGVLTVIFDVGHLDATTERRLMRVTELLAYVIRAVDAQNDLRRAADERAALGRVAELVADGAPSTQVFHALAAEASLLLQGQAMTVTRFVQRQELLVVASEGGPTPVGERITFLPDTLPDRVVQLAAVVRIDDYRGERDADLAAHYGLVASVAAPIVVAGKVWGMLTATSDERPLAPDTERRLDAFIRLVATTLSASEAHAELQTAADEQAALRHVAELASRSATVDAVFEAVTAEGARLVGVDSAMLLHYDSEGGTETLASNGGFAGITAGMPASMTQEVAVERLWRTGRAARVDLPPQTGLVTTIAVPILVEESLWGALVVLSRQEPLPVGIEDRLADFADLVATAITMTQTRRQLRALADQQAGLRSLSELLARGVPPPQVFAALTREASTRLGGIPVALVLCGDATFEITSSSGPADLDLDGCFARRAIEHVCRTGRPAWAEADENPLPAAVTSGREALATVAVPVAIEGSVRAALVSSLIDRRSATGTEAGLARFAELAAVAIANADARTRLTASRARLVATADETRRRLQRDVHNGAQQRLVHTIIALKLARAEADAESALAKLIGEALTNAEQASRQLREVVHDILPASLAHGGLRPALESLLDGLPLPVEIEIDIPRLNPSTEITAYLIIAEALNNSINHAQAQRLTLFVRLDGSTLIVEVGDDGVGGADPARGTGLTGLADRIEAADGVLTLISTPGLGTTVRADLPAV